MSFTILFSFRLIVLFIYFLLFIGFVYQFFLLACFWFLFFIVVRIKKIWVDSFCFLVNDSCGVWNLNDTFFFCSRKHVKNAWWFFGKIYIKYFVILKWTRFFCCFIYFSCYNKLCQYKCICIIKYFKNYFYFFQRKFFGYYVLYISALIFKILNFAGY